MDGTPCVVVRLHGGWGGVLGIVVAALRALLGDVVRSILGPGRELENGVAPRPSALHEPLVALGVAAFSVLGFGGVLVPAHTPPTVLQGRILVVLAGRGAGARGVPVLLRAVLEIAVGVVRVAPDVAVGGWRCMAAVAHLKSGFDPDFERAAGRPRAVAFLEARGFAVALRETHAAALVARQLLVAGVALAVVDGARAALEALLEWRVELVGLADVRCGERRALAKAWVTLFGGDGLLVVLGERGGTVVHDAAKVVGGAHGVDLGGQLLPEVVGLPVFDVLWVNGDVR